MLYFNATTIQVIIINQNHGYIIIGQGNDNKTGVVEYEVHIIVVLNSPMYFPLI